jgi:hypothetical protein
VCFRSLPAPLRALASDDDSLDRAGPKARVELLQTISNHRPQVIGDFDMLPFNV